MNTLNRQETSNNRGAQYGPFSEMARLAQTLKAALITNDMSDVQKESLQLICTKLARIRCGNPNNVDSWFDIAGYANLVVEDLNDPKVKGLGDLTRAQR